MTGQQTSDDASAGTGAAEYLAGALGGLLVLALVAFLTYQALGAREAGAEVSLVVTGVEEGSAGWAVHVTAVNSGGQTAEAVQVGGAVVRDGRRVEEASTSIAYLPPHSTRTGVLVFTTDPGSGDLRVGPVGYRVP